MSILIKGMEMPTSCESCPCKTADAFGGLGCQATGYIPLRKANQDRPEWCPLVPVHPHGRLIDADALKENWTHRDLDLFAQGWDYLKGLNRAPTIIPASFENPTKNARYSQDNPAEEGE